MFTASGLQRFSGQVAGIQKHLGLMDDFFCLQTFASAALITAYASGFVSADDHHIVVVFFRDPDKQTIFQSDRFAFFCITQSFYGGRILSRLRCGKELKFHAVNIGFRAFRCSLFFLECLSIPVKTDGLFVHILLVILHLEGNRARGGKFQAHREAVIFQGTIRREGNHQSGRAYCRRWCISLGIGGCHAGVEMTIVDAALDFAGSGGGRICGWLFSSGF